MAFTLVLTKNGAVEYTFTFTPMVAINYEFLYNKSALTAKVSGIQETWNVTEAVMLNSSPTSLATDWATLVNFFGERDDDVISIKLKSDSTTLHEMNTTTHYKMMVGNLQQLPSRGLHANHIPFSFTITGLKGLPGTETGGADDNSTTVTQLEQKLSFSYDQGGFLTKKLSGVVRTQGTGAEQAARDIGSLALPDSNFTYLTNGPEGCNVEVRSSPADDEATFECIVQEQGLAYPNTSVYRFMKTERVERTRYADYLVTTVLAQASTEAIAEAACLAEKPDNCEGYNIERVKETRTVSITFYSKTSRQSFLSKSYDYRLSGGGRPTVVVETLYGAPVLGKGPEQPVVVEEEVRVRAYRDSPALYFNKGAFFQTALDEASQNFSINRVAESANDAKFDEYEARLQSRYVYKRDNTDAFGQIKTTFASL